MAAAQAGNIDGLLYASSTRSSPNILDCVKKAAQEGNIEGLYAAIRSHPDILEHIDGIPFVDTPLHEAASAGQTHFALEIMSLKPSFGKKLNPDGQSPLDLALKARRFETVKRLIKLDSELIRVKGKGRRTPLHYVAETHDQNCSYDHVDLLAEFLCACPASIRDLTIREETALHIAVKSSNLQAFNVHLAWLMKSNNTDLLNWTDEEGNTVLHSAVLNKQHEMVRLLVQKADMIKNERNLEGLTALDIALALGTVEAITILSCGSASKASSLPEYTNLREFLISREKFSEFMIRSFLNFQKELSSEMGNMLLVVAVLIATATYQAVLSPPGAFSLQQGGGTGNGNGNSPTNTSTTHSLEGVFPLTSDAGKVGRGLFIGFYWLNTIAFTSSIAIISIVLQWRRLGILLHLSLISLVASYVLSLFLLLRLGLIDVSLTIVSSILAYYGYGYNFSFWIMGLELADDTKSGIVWLQYQRRKFLSKHFKSLSKYLMTRGRLRMLRRLVGNELNMH